MNALMPTDVVIKPHEGLGGLAFGSPRGAIIDKFGAPHSERTVAPSLPQHTFLSMEYPPLGLGFHLYPEHGLQTVTIAPRVKNVTLLGINFLDLCNDTEEHLVTIKRFIEDIRYASKERFTDIGGQIIISIPALKISFHFDFVEEPSRLQFLQVWGPHVECW